MATLDWRQASRRGDREYWVQKGGRLGPWRGFVSKVNPYQERVTTIDAGGGSNAEVTHPYLSTHSWIRVMPDPNAYVLLSMTSDRDTAVIMNYENPRREQRVTNYLEEKGTYRLLRSGEIDIQSTGKSNVYLSRDGRLNLRGGTVYGHASHPDLEWMFKAPTTSIRGMHHRSSVIQDEIRFGAVKRGSPVSEYQRISGEVAKEFTVHLQRGEDDLAEMRMGDVIDKDGNTEVGTQTTNALRFKLRLMMDQLNSWKQEVDSRGNTSVILPSTADIGFQFVTPAANFRSTARNNDLFSFKNVNAIAGKNATISANREARVIGGDALRTFGPETVIRGGTILHPLNAASGLSCRIDGFNRIKIGDNTLGATPELYADTSEIEINSAGSIFIGDPLRIFTDPLANQPAVKYDDFLDMFSDLVSLVDTFFDEIQFHAHPAHGVQSPLLQARWFADTAPALVQLYADMAAGKGSSTMITLT